MEKEALAVEPIGVYGASGFTGKLVCQQLGHLKVPIVAVGRDEGRVRSSLAGIADIDVRCSNLAVRELCIAFTGVGAVIHCAGPFIETLQPMLEASFEAGWNLALLCDEQASLRALAAQHREAEQAGRTWVGGCGYATAMAELAAWLATVRMSQPRDLRVTTVNSPGIPSRGTLLSYLAEADEGGFVVDRGAFAPLSMTSAHVVDLGPPFGERTAVSAPLSEVLTLGRLFPTSHVSGYFAGLPPRAVCMEQHTVFFRDRDQLNSLARAREVTNRSGPTEAERTQSHFCMRVEATDDSNTSRSVTMKGVDPYGLTACLAAATALRLTKRPALGVRAAIEVLEPQETLALVAHRGVRWETASR